VLELVTLRRGHLVPVRVRLDAFAQLRPRRSEGEDVSWEVGISAFAGVVPHEDHEEDVADPHHGRVGRGRARDGVEVTRVAPVARRVVVDVADPHQRDKPGSYVSQAAVRLVRKSFRIQGHVGPPKVMSVEDRVMSAACPERMRRVSAERAYARPPCWRGPAALRARVRSTAMASNRQAIGVALLGGFFSLVGAGVSLSADHVVLGLFLILASVAALAVAVLLFRRPRKRLVVSREVADAFARSGSIMGEPPRYESTLRERR